MGVVGSDLAASDPGIYAQSTEAVITFSDKISQIPVGARNYVKSSFFKTVRLLQTSRNVSTVVKATIKCKDVTLIDQKRGKLLAGITNTKYSNSYQWVEKFYVFIFANPIF